MGYKDKACQGCLVDLNGSREVICVRCGTNVPRTELNENHVCRKCAAVPDLPCKECGILKNPVYLNTKGVCKDCATRYCKVCGQILSSTNNSDLCPNCIDVSNHTCSGCGTEFMPTWDQNQFCGTCDKKIQGGVCLYCGRSGKEYRFVNELGVCNICLWENKTAKHLCTFCKEEEVENKGDYCKKCLSPRCSHCGVKEVFSEHDVCDTCKKAFNEPDFEDKEY